MGGSALALHYLLREIPAGADALGLDWPRLIPACLVICVLGGLMTIGVGLYAPCMILVSLMGMNPIAAFPIMMGACAFLMPVASTRFLLSGKHHLQAALGCAQLRNIDKIIKGVYMVLTWVPIRLSMSQVKRI